MITNKPELKQSVSDSLTCTRMHLGSLSGDSKVKISRRTTWLYKLVKIRIFMIDTGLWTLYLKNIIIKPIHYDFLIVKVNNYLRGRQKTINVNCVDWL